MLSPESSKRRSARIGLDHFRAVDGIARAKLGLSLVASVASIAWLGGVGVDLGGWPKSAEGLATHGPLTKAHAKLEVSCQSCHVPFESMDSQAWLAQLASSPRSSDTKCSSCHQTIGGHRSSVKESDIASCASCHRDHRGRDVSLTAMPDRDCTRCHAETDRHMKPGATPTLVASVTRFDAEQTHHPEFALFRDGKANDPGRLKFSHALHMTKGFNLEPGGRPIKTLADLLDTDREKYRTTGQADRDPVQLRCDSCHQGAADRRANPNLGETAGAYMRPIRFEQDCRACHPLDFDPQLPAIRHGLQPDAVNETLWQSYSARYYRGGAGAREAWMVPRPVPGREGRSESSDGISDDVIRAERILSGEKRCGECHTFERNDGRPVAELSASARISPVGIPDHWLRRATFDHSKHRAARCVDCHARAFPETPDASRSGADVLIPTIAVCLSCHSPKAPASNRAASGCVDCHRYHNGERPRHAAGLSSLVESSPTNPASSSNPVLRWIMASQADSQRSNRQPTGERQP